MPEPQFGHGANQSPPDENDLVIPVAAARRVAARAATLAAFRLGNRPPITNQGNTPQCVAFATGEEQNWQDHVEHGRFYDFDENEFFKRIGGNQYGAHARAALDELITSGYPTTAPTPAANQHKARLYSRVVMSAQAIKDAIVACGGVLVVGPWFDNWTARSGTLQVLPRPSGAGTGHEWWAVGWDEFGCLGQQSWGPLWGDGGLFRMPWQYLVTLMWEAWTTLDDDTTPLLFDKARMRTLDVAIRQERTLQADQLQEGQRWARTTPQGIRRLRDNKIVLAPWDRLSRFGGFRDGPRHNIAPFPEQWARLYMDGAWRVAPRPTVRVHWAD